MVVLFELMVSLEIMTFPSANLKKINIYSKTYCPYKSGHTLVAGEGVSILQVVNNGAAIF